MSETIVLYSSRYGAARQYARMAAEELGCVARDLKDVRSGASGDKLTASSCAAASTPGGSPASPGSGRTVRRLRIRRWSCSPWGPLPGTREL